jgi:hypothetical protein
MEDDGESVREAALLRTLRVLNHGGGQNACSTNTYAKSHVTHGSAPPAPEKISRFVTQEQEGITPFGVLQMQVRNQVEA